MKNWKLKLITWIAAGEPVLINYVMMHKNVPEGMSIMVNPPPGTRDSWENYEGKAFLVPLRNVVCEHGAGCAECYQIKGSN